jgi:RNA methyltransferase, TrmH family
VSLSARNPKVRRLRRLARHRSDRETEGVFIIEGPTLVEEALALGHPVEAIFAEPDRATDFAGRGVDVVELDADLLARVADTRSPQGVLAITVTPRYSLDDLRLDGLLFVLAGVADPGNAGTLIRAAEAAGALAVLCCDGATDPFAPKCVRAAAGSVLRIPVVARGKGSQVLERLGAAGVRRLGTGAGAGMPYDRADLTGPLALVVGHETHGLPAEVDAALDGWVHIPMAGAVESLNVGVAGAVIAFESARQRRAGVAPDAARAVPPGRPSWVDS